MSKVLRLLQRTLPARDAVSKGFVLEVGSGDGSKCASWATALPEWTFQPSEFDANALPRITQHCMRVPNMLMPVQLDAASTKWPVETGIDAVCAVNLCHVAPLEASRGLLAGAANVLRPGGTLCVYGPFRVEGVSLGFVSRAFNAIYRLRDSQAGIRDLGEYFSRGALGDSRLKVASVERVHGDHYWCVWRRADPDDNEGDLSV